VIADFDHAPADDAEILDLTENFCRGWIWPTAMAFSVMAPLSTATSLTPSLSSLLERART
jgi:hypothetical protein